MIEVEGKTLNTVDEITRWFVDAAIKHHGVGPSDANVGETLSRLPCSDEVAEAIVRVLDRGPTPARAAACTYLGLRPVNAAVLRQAWMRWVSPAAAWLEDKGSTSGAKMGTLLASAAESCGVANDAATSAAFVRLAHRYDTWRLWTLAIVHADPAGRGLHALREGITHGVRLSTGDADMLAWRYATHAPTLLAAVGGLLASHAVAVRSAFFAEAKKQLDPEQAAAVATVMGL